MYRTICAKYMYSEIEGCVWGERGLYDSRTLGEQELGRFIVDTASCINLSGL